MSSIYNAGPVYSGIHTLLGLPYDKDAKDADVALYGMPFDISTPTVPDAVSARKESVSMDSVNHTMKNWILISLMILKP
ncbi:MAG: hypothetical protein ACLSG9_03340 [Eubacterium sp.]